MFKCKCAVNKLNYLISNLKQIKTQLSINYRSSHHSDLVHLNHPLRGNKANHLESHLHQTADMRFVFMLMFKVHR